MKEKKLNISINRDETLVDDKSGKLQKELKSIYDNLNLNLGFCYNQLIDGKLTEGMKETNLSLAEHYLVEFLDKVGYDSILKKDIDKRHKEIKELNEENRKLRSQLGNKISNEDVREKVKNLDEFFTNWWSEFGFGHASNISFQKYFAEIKLSGHIFKNRPSTEESKKDYLSKLGFKYKDSRVISSENNFKLLLELLQSKFPSVEVTDIKLFVDADNIQTYKEITIIINDYDDFNQ